MWSVGFLHLLIFLLHLISQQEIVLVEGSRVFESWKNPPPPVYMEFFFFNVTNEDMVLKGAKPELSQVGPYTYRYGARVYR